MSREEFCGVLVELLETFIVFKSSVVFVMGDGLFWFLDWYLLSSNWSCPCLVNCFSGIHWWQGPTFCLCSRVYYGFFITWSVHFHTSVPPSLRHRGISGLSKWLLKTTKKQKFFRLSLRKYYFFNTCLIRHHGISREFF